MTSLFGRRPTDDEIFEATGITRAQRLQLENLPAVTASLDQPASSDSTTTLGELVGSNDDSWIEGIERNMMHDQLKGALNKLTDLQREVLNLRYGLNGGAPLSLQATAQKMDIGVRRVRRAEEEALEILREDPEVLSQHENA